MQCLRQFPLFCRSPDLQGHANQNYNVTLLLSLQSKEELAGKTCSLERQGSIAQTTDFVHHLRCLFPRLWCNGTRTGGPMGPPRAGNAHKLLAATLAVKTLKYLTGMTMLLQLDSQTSVAYINNMGGHSISPFDRSPLGCGL